MTCRECKCCHPTTYKRWDSNTRNFVKVDVNECWGVREKFKIEYLDAKCTEYPQEYWDSKTNMR